MSESKKNPNGLDCKLRINPSNPFSLILKQRLSQTFFKLSMSSANFVDNRSLCTSSYLITLRTFSLQGFVLCDSSSIVI